MSKFLMLVLSVFLSACIFSEDKKTTPEEQSFELLPYCYVTMDRDSLSIFNGFRIDKKKSPNLLISWQRGDYTVDTLFGNSKWDFSLNDSVPAWRVSIDSLQKVSEEFWPDQNTFTFKVWKYEGEMNEYHLFEIYVDSLISFSWEYSEFGYHVSERLEKLVGDTTFVWENIEKQNLVLNHSFPTIKTIGNYDAGLRKEWRINNRNLWEIHEMQYRDTTGRLVWDVDNTYSDTTFYEVHSLDSVKACY